MKPPSIAPARPADRWPRYQPLVLVAVAVAVGIACDRGVGGSLIAWWLTALAAWAGWLLAWRRGYERLSNAPLLLALAAVGGVWHHQRWNLFAEDEIGLAAREQPRPICLEAVALGSPRRVPAPPPDPLCAIPRGERSRFRVRVCAARAGDAWRPASGVMQVWVDGGLAGVEVGDRVRIVGQLTAPAAAQNAGEFDFALHARADRQLSRLSADFPECVQVVERGGNWSLRRLLDQLRQRGDELLWRHLRENQARLAAALLLGIREELALDTTAAFAQTGTIHILSISGMHIALLAGFLFAVMRLGMIDRRLGLSGVAAVTLVYALVIDAEPPAVRAAVLVLFVCLARFRRRASLPFNLLAAAGLLVLAMNPCELFRIGPQLSFIAVATLAWAGPRLIVRASTDPLDRLIARTRPWPEKFARRSGRRVWQMVAVSAVVWATGAPLVLSQFHLLSPATLLLTPILALPITAALLCGFSLLACGWLVPPLGAALGAICDRSLAATTYCVESFAALPGSHFWLPGPSPWWLVGVYLLIALFAILPNCRLARRWCYAALAGWTAAGFAAPLLVPAQAPQLACAFLSVGHGCAVVLELPDGKTLVYDAGRLGSPEAGARSVSGYLWHRGRTHIDAIVLSHADVDHYNAVPELLEKFTVGVIYATPAMLRDEGAAMQKLLAAIARSGVPLRETWSGDRLRTSADCRLEVWHPTRSGVLGGDNANSLVLSVEYGGRRILLTGDLESPGMDDVLAESPVDCDVILAPHHGSARSNPPGFAAWSTPELVVVSGSHGDRRREVEQAYHERGATIAHTADTGSVTVSIGPAGDIQVAAWKADQHIAPGIGDARVAVRQP
jgi:competence protein ComEC